MSDKDELAKQRAREAMQVMETPLLVESFDKLEAGLIRKMVTSNLEDAAGREQARYQLEALKMLRLELQHVLDTGKFVFKAEQDQKDLDDFREQEGLGVV